MAECVLVYGKSGSGKSRSLKNFAENEIFLVNTIGKRLPFPKNFTYTINGTSLDRIKAGLSKMPTKIAVIDDAGYLQTDLFMRGHMTGDQFKLYNMIGDTFWQLVNFIKEDLPNDVIVYVMMHEETSDFGETKLKTIGKLLDQKVCLEGMVTICLRAMVKGDKHIFTTQSNGMDISKSPEGMFDAEIDNDLKAVDTKIREYWKMPSSTVAKQQPQAK